MANAPGRRVFIHVGSPKTGTTFLQNVLWQHKSQAAEQGLLLPLDRFNDHFLATLDVRNLADRPPHSPRASGMWGRVVDAALAWPGTSLISHELFAGASADQARDAMGRIGARAEVHIVLTVRDLVRQMTAEWQEHVKHRATRTLEEFVTDVRQDTRRRSWFWQVQDFAGVAERWAVGIPPERVHIVTVPPVGAAQGLLWDRFAGLLGLDPASFDTSVARSNTSLGLEQTELLRRVNVALGDRLEIPGPYPAVVKDILAHRLLAARPGRPLALAAPDVDYAVSESRAQGERLAAAGYHVVGDLGEIVPVTAGPAVERYEVPDDRVLLDESIAAIADLLVDLDERRGRRGQAQEGAPEPRSRVKETLIRASERHAVVMKAREAYQRHRPRG